MSSPPDSSSEAELIQNPMSPISTDSSPHPSSPPSPGSPSLHRSKTAPPPLPYGASSIPFLGEPFTSIPPPRTAATPAANAFPPAPDSPSQQNTPQHQPSALRRSSSSLSSGSVPGSREKKRLRFTPVTAAAAELDSSGLGEDVDDVFFRGASLEHAEEGRGRGRKGMPRDQDWLRSDPGTPNILET